MSPTLAAGDRTVIPI